MIGLLVSKRSREEATVKIPVRVSSVVRGFATSKSLAAGAIFSAPALAVHLTAGDVSAKSADSLNITGSIAGGNATATSGRRVAEGLPCVGVCEPTIWHVGGSAITGVGNRLSSSKKRVWMG